MRNPTSFLLVLCATLSMGGARREADPLHGVVNAKGRGVRALVTAQRAGSAMRTTVSTDSTGRFSFGTLQDGVYRVSARAEAFRDVVLDSVRIPSNADVALSLHTAAPVDEAYSAAWLGLLADGEAKRHFVLDCTGCHLFDGHIAHPGGRPRTRAQWIEAVGRMLGYAGATTGFPVISSTRDPDSTAALLAPQVQAMPVAPFSALGAVPARMIGRARITEYDVPGQGDLPHDLALEQDGHVVVTGMFSHVLYRLDPADGTFTSISLPVPNANPRALEIDRAGDWWVALGAPHKVARYRPATLHWDLYDIDVYPHSVAVDNAGGAWFNGHFTHDPELIGRAGSDGVTFRSVPPHTSLRTDAGGPIPYELRVAADGRVWGSELHGDRIFVFDPRVEVFELHSLPVKYSGPRRFDVDAAGNAWIPAYGANSLVRLDRAGTFHDHVLPIHNAVPYVARVRAGDGVVWIGTSAADAVLSFEPATQQFTVYPLPSRGAMIRHMAIAPDGSIWVAFGASPGALPARIAHIQPQN